MGAISKDSGFSNLGEEGIIKKYLDSMSLKNRYCVDIAASDGITMSNTLFLFENKWAGLAVEFDPERFASLATLYRKFPDVNLVKTKVIPENVVALLNACQCPKEFSFLNFDIDGYDFFVLDKLLAEFKPRLICVEINEKIPPPISFTVNYDPEYEWNEDHFYGQSISKCYELCVKYGYDIVELHYNNLFLVPAKINKWGSLSPEQAYTNGYKNKKDRREKFPWNSDMERLQNMSSEQGIEFLRSRFSKYNGKYRIK